MYMYIYIYICFTYMQSGHNHWLVFMPIHKLGSSLISREDSATRPYSYHNRSLILCCLLTLDPHSELCMHIYQDMHAYMYIYMYMYMDVYVYIYMYKYRYIYIYVYVYIESGWLWQSAFFELFYYLYCTIHMAYTLDCVAVWL